MDSPGLLKTMSRSSSHEARNTRTPLSDNVRALSRSLDSWKERQKLEIAAKGQLDASKGQQVINSPKERCESARQTIIRLTTQEATGETEASQEESLTAAKQRPHEFPFHEKVDNDRKTISSHNISGSHCSSSSSTSISGVFPHPSSPVSPSSQLLHLHDEEKAEESRIKKKGESRNQATREVRSSQTITTDIAGIVARTRAELTSSPFFLKSASSPVSNSSTRSVSAIFAHSAGDNAGEDEKCVSQLNGRKRVSEILVRKDAPLDAQEDDILSNLDSRSIPKTTGSDDTNNEEDNTRDVDDGDERTKHQQKNIVTQVSLWFLPYLIKWLSYNTEMCHAFPRDYLFIFFYFYTLWSYSHLNELSLSLSLFLVFMSPCLYISVSISPRYNCAFPYLSIYLSIYLSMCFFLDLFLCIRHFGSAFLSFYLSLSLLFCLSVTVSLPFCLSVGLCLSASVKNISTWR